MSPLRNCLYNLEEFLAKKGSKPRENNPTPVSRYPRKSKELTESSSTLPDDAAQSTSEKIDERSPRQHRRSPRKLVVRKSPKSREEALKSDIADAKEDSAPASSPDASKMNDRDLRGAQVSRGIRPPRRKQRRINGQKLEHRQAIAGTEPSLMESSKSDKVPYVPRKRSIRAVVQSADPSPGTVIPSFVTDVPQSSEERKFTKLLDFYGLQWTSLNPEPLDQQNRRKISSTGGLRFYLENEDLLIRIGNSHSGAVAHGGSVGHEQFRSARNHKSFQYRDFRRMLWKYEGHSTHQERMPRIEYVLVSTDKIRSRVIELGSQISAEYSGRTPVFVGVLNGGLCFLADLVRAMSLPLAIDFLGFSKVSQGGASIQTNKSLETTLKGKDVIIVDNLADTGLTLNHTMNYVSTMEPRSLAACVLARNRAHTIVDRHIPYLGFDIRDEYTVGYGSGFLGRFRNLPFVGVVRPNSYPQ